MTWRAPLVALTALVVGGCATTGVRPAAVAPPAPRAEIGLASWYDAPRGARGLTAAHRTLPLGTRVRVTNLDNGRRALLVITGRGPFRRSRILDVSRHAARRLGFLTEGTARVRLEVLERP
ncbi:MAG TPA: septal ring lytic transglycosylase RlpA family protein [Candidatus Eisenbacteria bacterium]|nr:septal ring lytic transglycosylase RlpA family protein [Candidatus Eisenbacteria bacterium]